MQKAFEALRVWQSAQHLQTNCDDYLLNKLFNFPQLNDTKIYTCVNLKFDDLYFILYFCKLIVY